MTLFFQLKLYQAGERLVDRMDFEELALKSIDASLGPSITKKRLKEPENKNEDREKEQVQVSRTFFPYDTACLTYLTKASVTLPSFNIVVLSGSIRVVGIHRT